MSEFGNEEKDISQYSSQTNGALAEWTIMRRSEIPEIVVRFHGVPLEINDEELKIKNYADSCNEIVSENFLLK